MSTATAEKPKEAPVNPLGSFITKLAPPPKPVEKVEEPKPAEKETNNAAATAAPTEHAKPTPAPTEPTPAQETAKTLEKPDADGSDVAKKLELADKRVKDTQRSWHEEHQARLTAERELRETREAVKRLEQKFDGTYVEPTAPSTEQIAADADVKGRIRASHKAAVRQYGEAFVMETVWNQDSPYQELQAKSPRIRTRVMEAEDPVLEAIAVVKEHQDAQRYGSTPEEIRKKLEEELKPQLEKQILEGLKTKPGPATKTLGNVRGGSERTEQKNDAPARLDFRQVFPWGASRT